MWIVRLKKRPLIDDFKKGFFPRKVYYLNDAKALVAEVKRKGGEALIERDRSKVEKELNQ